jgi:acyl-CoA reductase-like NAD-dependent aldehyde dehydrogenase
MNIPIVHFDDTADGEPPRVIEPNGFAQPNNFSSARAAQKDWSALPVKERVRVVRGFRELLVTRAAELVRAKQPRDEAAAAEVLASEIIPLADACRFLERNAVRLLRAQRLSRWSAPMWLSNTRTEVRREAHGLVLIVAPSNYPIFLPAVALVQALVGGNAVLLKPAPRCGAVANVLLRLLRDAGLPENLVVLLGEDQRDVYDAIGSGVNKVVLTGSANAGRAVLRACAEKLIPATMELSGCDAMFVRADADVSLAARALVFGLRWNRGATCIAPRRVFVHQSRAAEFESACLAACAQTDPFTVAASVERTVAPLIVEAAAKGARVIHGEVDHHGQVTAPVLVADANVSMRLMREDHFGPAAAIVPVTTDDEALALNEQCPYALGASVFSANEAEANAFAQRINAGVVTVDDVIAPTADPRVPFGGRKHSGFGVTRGAEGLLEMTVPKVVITRRGLWRPHFEEPREGDAQFFQQFLALIHAGTWRERFRAGLALFRLARERTTTRGKK